MNHEEEFNVEGYEQAFKNDPLFEDLDYQDQDPPPAGKPAGNQAYEEQYEDEDLEAENFPEPAATGGGGKPGNSKMRMYVLGGLGALVVAFGGTYFLAPDVFGDMPAQLMSTLTGAETPAEPAPDPVVAKPHKKPIKPADEMAAKPAGDDAAPAPDPAKPRPHANKPGAHKPAAKPADTAAKPADDADAPKTDGAEFKPKAHKPAAKPAAVAAAPDAPVAKPAPKKPVAKPQPMAKKPPAKPVAAAAAGAKPSAAAAPSATTAVAFQRGSYWVSASEVERLWAFSSRAKGTGGQFTVESWVGSEKNGLDLSRKRANRVAELLQKNTAPNAYKVTVKVHGTSTGKAAPGKVSVSYSDGSKL